LLSELTVEDEASFLHVGLYRELKGVLATSGYTFRVFPNAHAASWSRASFLNLTYWGAASGGDVLQCGEIPADVVTHVAWHHLANRALARTGEALSAAAMFLGEAIASAFDLYLIGRLLGHAPKSTFLTSQVAAMADVAFDEGTDEAAFEALLASTAKAPEAAFEDLRRLLFDATCALYTCHDADEAEVALGALADRRFACILHHYELSNWVLYARAYAPKEAPEDRARSLDATLRAQADSLDWLTREWVGPSLGRGNAFPPPPG
jgi:hypothetical protein